MPIQTCGNFKIELTAGEECDSQTAACLACYCDRNNGFFPESPPVRHLFLGPLFSFGSPSQTMFCRWYNLSAVDAASLDPCYNQTGTLDLCGVCREKTDPNFNSCLGCDQVPFSGKKLGPTPFY